MTTKFDGFVGPTFTSTTLPLATTPGKHVYVSDLETLAVCYENQWYDMLTGKPLGSGGNEVVN
jgi:hypothetical protein